MWTCGTVIAYATFVCGVDVEVINLRVHDMNHSFLPALDAVTLLEKLADEAQLVERFLLLAQIDDCTTKILLGPDSSTNSNERRF